MKNNLALPMCLLFAQVSTATDLVAPTMPHVGEYYTFQAGLADKLGIYGTRSYLDRFGWQTQVGWIYTYGQLDYGVNDKIGSVGRSLFKSALVNTTRETAAHLPITETWESWAENLYIGLLGNTAEESISPGSITPSASEISWWQEQKHSGRIAYGLRIDGPSAYASFRLGRYLDNPAMILHTRLYYRPFDEIKLDLNFVSPLPWGELSGGVTVNILRMEQAGDLVASLRMSHNMILNPIERPSNWLESLSWYVGCGYSYESRSMQLELGISGRLPE